MHMSDHIEDFAKEHVGNWRKFASFAWHEKPEDCDMWAIFNVTSRDATLREQSNHAAMEKALAPFLGWHKDGADAEVHEASHWAVGWVGGFQIRVYDKEGKITPAFAAYAELAIGLEEYPVIDESDLSEREHAAALDNIAQEGRRLVSARAPKSWPGRVFSWLWEHEQSECEDDGQGQGAYPSEESIARALVALKMANRETWLARERGQ